MPMVKATTLVALVCAGAWAAEENPAPDHRVSVCTELARDFLVHRAETMATGMFAEIGVRMVWLPDTGCPPGAIRISFSDRAEHNFRPEALAYALPYEKTHIQVFYDRLRLHPRRQQTVLLAHVLVHEIAHIIEGVARHSASGIMMARWGKSEYADMTSKPLRFTDEDIRLIRLGVQARESRLAAAGE